MRDRMFCRRDPHEISPESTGGRIKLRPGLRKVLANIGWLVADRVFAMAVSLVVGVLLARHLKAEGFGLLSYALSFLSLFAFISSLGLENIVVREIVREPSSRDEILGSSFLLQVIGGFAAAGAAILGICLLRPGDTLTQGIVGIVSFGAVFKASTVVTFWFKSQVASKYTVIARDIAILLGMAVILALIFLGASVEAFAWALLGQAVLSASALVLAYRVYGKSPFRWVPRMSRVLSLLRSSWPLAISALAVTVYMKIDQVMLGEMVDDRAVGIYAAAVRLWAAWYFVPMAIAGSVFPAILKTREKDLDLYYGRLQRLYDFMTWLAIAVAVATTFLSGWIVDLLYGREYHEAASVLALHVWSAVFVFQGVAASQWILAEDLQRYNQVFTVAACLVNVGINYWLIPKHGGYGAAIATLLSYGLAVLVFPAFFARTRRRSIMLASSIVWPARFLLRLMVSRRRRQDVA